MIPAPYSVARYWPWDVPRSEWGWHLTFRAAPKRPGSKGQLLGVYFVPGDGRGMDPADSPAARITRRGTAR